MSTMLHDERARRITRRRRAGDSYAAIAADEGVSRQRVAKIAALVGAPQTHAGKRRADERCGTARATAAATPGVTTRELAEILGVTVEHAARLARRAGLERTATGWAAS